MKVLKVCHVTSSHQRYDGRVFQKECVSLAKKYDVTLLCSDLNKDEIKDGVTIKSLGINNKNRKNRFFVIPRKLKKQCLNINADVYHFHDPELISLAGYMKKREKIVIFDSHEDNVNRIDNRTWIPKLFKPIVKKIYANKEKKVFKMIDTVITVNEDISKRIKKANLNTFVITNYPIITNIKLPVNRPTNVLCFAGGVHKQYMHHNIIKAIEGLDVKYIVAGPYNDDYYKELTELKDYGKVQLLGSVSKEKCNELYSKSTIGMVLIDYVPNINYKKGSLGITKIFEYMQYGLPVIATDLDVWLDFVPNQCGICVNPNNIEEIHNAIEYLINHPREAEEMGKRGQQLVKEKYNWGSQEKKLYEIYQSFERGKNEI